MSVGRETIYSTFFSQLQTLVNAPTGTGTGQPFNYCSRRYAPIGKLSITQYPSLFLVERGELYEWKLLYGPAKVTLVCHVVIQSQIAEDPNVVDATLINNLADAVEDCINDPGPGGQLFGHNQLGNPPLVQVVRISGREVVYLATQLGRFSEQDFEVELVVPH